MQEVAMGLGQDGFRSGTSGRFAAPEPDRLVRIRSWSRSGTGHDAGYVMYI